MAASTAPIQLPTVERYIRRKTLATPPASWKFNGLDYTGIAGLKVLADATKLMSRAGMWLVQWQTTTVTLREVDGLIQAEPSSQSNKRTRDEGGSVQTAKHEDEKRSYAGDPERARDEERRAHCGGIGTHG